VLQHDQIEQVFGDSAPQFMINYISSATY